MNAKRWQLLGAGALFLLALGMALRGDLTVEDRVARMATELDAELASRDVHIDPGELLDLMNNNQVRIAILDARTEGEFNVFHLQDALHVGALPDGESVATRLPQQAVKVVVSNGETRADGAWKRLRALGIMNVYVLATGLEGWFGAYGGGRRHDDLEIALGDRHPIAAPSARLAPKREYTAKVKVLDPIGSAGGGCG